MPLRAVIFDFDGVLADTERLHLRAFQSVLAEHGLALSDADYYHSYLGLDDAGVFGVVGTAAGRSFAPAEIAALVARKAVVMENLLSDGSPLFPGAEACVGRLAGRLPLAIASGALRHEIEGILQRAGLLPSFRAIVAAGETPRSKPAPDPYRRALDLLGIEPASAVAVEDSRWGIEAAAAAGMRTVGITHTYPAGELTGADRTIASLDELTVPLLQALVDQGSSSTPV